MKLSVSLLCFALFAPVFPATILAAEQQRDYAEPPMPAYRVEAQRFNAGARDIKAVCDSAGRELWRFFPGYEIEPFVITRGQSGPITLFKRNNRGEIVIRLDTGDTYWSQYAYQFAHEFCHVLCGYEDDFAGNKWFEETLCETASLFVMRRMAKAWQDDPPYSHWKDYRHALGQYADNIISNRPEAIEIYEKGMAGFYQAHQEELSKNPTLRNLNSAMALVFLRLFEEDPNRWETIRWLNNTPSVEGETFQQYLRNWHAAVPERHKPFVKKVATLYGM